MHSKIIFKVVMFFASYAIAMPCYCEISHISIEELNELVTKNSKGVTIVDVRAPIPYITEHIAGAINIPLAAVGGYGFPIGGYIVFYCSGTGCPLGERATVVLTGKGHKNVAALAGGIEAWKNKGLPVVSEKRTGASKASGPAHFVAKISASELFASISQGKYLIVDTRSANEFSAGHIKGAVNIPLEEIATKSRAISKDSKIVVYARLPDVSRTASKQFIEAGFKVFELSGGLPVWAAQGYALAAGTEGSGQ